MSPRGRVRSPAQLGRLGRAGQGSPPASGTVLVPWGALGGGLPAPGGHRAAGSACARRSSAACSPLLPTSVHHGKSASAAGCQCRGRNESRGGNPCRIVRPVCSAVIFREHFQVPSSSSAARLEGKERGATLCGNASPCRGHSGRTPLLGFVFGRGFDKPLAFHQSAAAPCQPTPAVGHRAAAQNRCHGEQRRRWRFYTCIPSLAQRAPVPHPPPLRSTQGPDCSLLLAAGHQLAGDVSGGTSAGLAEAAAPPASPFWPEWCPGRLSVRSRCSPQSRTRSVRTGLLGSAALSPDRPVAAVPSPRTALRPAPWAPARLRHTSGTRVFLRARGLGVWGPWCGAAGYGIALQPGATVLLPSETAH